MKTKLLLTVLCCFLGMSFTYAQAQQKTQFNTEKKAKLVKTTKLNANSNQNANRKVDQYMGKKEKILNVLKVDYIPADFPKYAIGSNRENYRNTVKIWLKNHLDIVKEEYHAKLANF